MHAQVRQYRSHRKMVKVRPQGDCETKLRSPSSWLKENSLQASACPGGMGIQLLSLPSKGRNIGNLCRKSRRAVQLTGRRNCW